jgi:hypothetical protein
MVRVTLAVTFTFVLSTLANPLAMPQLPDPSADKNVGNGAGNQLVNGQCVSNADCAANACCAGFQDIAVCSSLTADKAHGKTGCMADGESAGA